LLTSLGCIATRDGERSRPFQSTTREGDRIARPIDADNGAPTPDGLFPMPWMAIPAQHWSNRENDYLCVSISSCSGSASFSRPAEGTFPCCQIPNDRATGQGTVLLAARRCLKCRPHCPGYLTISNQASRFRRNGGDHVLNPESPGSLGSWAGCLAGVTGRASSSSLEPLGGSRRREVPRDMHPSR
jgi:hypothetical protein